MQSQIRLDMTRDGLRIQIVDEGNRPMFDSGSAVVKPYMRDLLRAIGSVLGEVPNRLTLEGHTDAQPFGGGDRGYSNWELSADRANASRRELMAGGLPEDRRCGCRAWPPASPSTARTRWRREPPHQHHRDEPRGRRPLLPHRTRRGRAGGEEPPPASIAPHAGVKSRNCAAARIDSSSARVRPITHTIPPARGPR
jgi:hypothetical protein